MKDRELLASLLLALGGLAIGILGWREGLLPGWLAMIAIASGALGILGGLSLLFEPFSAARTAGVIVWTTFAGIVGARESRRAFAGAR